MGIEIVGTIAFSISGSFAAMEKRLDIFGIFILAFVTALGGGTIRDVLVGDVPVRWMRDLNPLVIVFSSTILAMIIAKSKNSYQKTLLLFDSIGVGFFTVLGIQTGIILNLHPVICISLGTITACFGGVIRDVLLNNIPLIFQKELYATTCILGGIMFFLLKKMDLPRIPLESICIIMIVLLRLLSVKFKWQLPVIRSPDQPTT